MHSRIEEARWNEDGRSAAVGMREKNRRPRRLGARLVVAGDNQISGT